MSVGVVWLASADFFNFTQGGDYVSWTLIKKEETPGFLKGMLAAFILCFWIYHIHPKSDKKTEASSLPILVACTHTIQEPFTPVFTEDKLDSVPIAPKEKKTEEKSEEKTQQTQKKDETERTYTRTPDKEPDNDGFDWEDEIIVDPPDIFGPDEGSDTSSGVFVPLTPGTTETSTERDADIPSTVITDEDSQSTTDGLLKIRIKRKIQ